MQKGLLSVVVGNTPDVRGIAVEQLLRLSPRAVLLAVSIENQQTGYPVVQRFLSSVDASVREASWGATGDPVVILRQDLMSLRRSSGPVHVVLALPGDVDVLPFLAELWRARVASGSLGDYYESAPVVVGVEPSSFMVDVGCVHRVVRLWIGRERGEALSPAEAAVRQVEAADVLLVPAPIGSVGEQASAAAALASQLNPRGRLVTPSGIDGGWSELPASLVRAAPPGAEDEWQAQLEPVTVPRKRYSALRAVETVLWRSRRPLHPGRLADALPVVMRGVVRGRGHLWLCSCPDSVVTWRSAGAHLELRVTDRWLEPADARAWEAASRSGVPSLPGIGTTTTVNAVTRSP